MRLFRVWYFVHLASVSTSWPQKVARSDQLRIVDSKCIHATNSGSTLKKPLGQRHSICFRIFMFIFIPLAFCRPDYSISEQKVPRITVILLFYRQPKLTNCSWLVDRLSAPYTATYTNLSLWTATKVAWEPFTKSDKVESFEWIELLWYVYVV